MDVIIFLYLYLYLSIVTLQLPLASINRPFVFHGKDFNVCLFFIISLLITFDLLNSIWLLENREKVENVGLKRMIIVCIHSKSNSLFIDARGNWRVTIDKYK